MANLTVTLHCLKFNTLGVEFERWFSTRDEAIEHAKQCVFVNYTVNPFVVLQANAAFLLRG